MSGLETNLKSTRPRPGYYETRLLRDQERDRQQNAETETETETETLKIGLETSITDNNNNNIYLPNAQT